MPQPQATDTILEKLELLAAQALAKYEEARQAGAPHAAKRAYWSGYQDGLLRAGAIVTGQD